jgi:hypothetical protein
MKYAFLLYGNEAEWAARSRWPAVCARDSTPWR